MENRYYSFRLVTYYTNVANIQPLLDMAYKWAYILHDKDKTDPHIHIICTFKQNKSFNAVKKLIVPLDGEKPQNTLAYLMDNKTEAYIYLDHRNEPDKHRYGENEIVTNDRSYFIGGVSKNIENAEFVDDLIALHRKKISLRSMAVKYGRDFMRNYNSYSTFGFLLSEEQHETERKEHIPIDDDSPWNNEPLKINDEN